MKIAICDDNVSQVIAIKELLKNYKDGNNDFEIISFITSNEILDAYQNGKKFDVVFLDIQIDEHTGIDVGNKIREVDDTVAIIFISNYADYAVQAFRLNAFQYITKPIDEILFYEELERCLHEKELECQKYVIHYKDMITILNISDIVYIESKGRKIQIYDKNKGLFETYGKIGEEEKKLKKWRFARCHQGFLINLNYIYQVEKNYITTTIKVGDEYLKVQMSKKKRKNIVDLLSTYI